MRYRRRRGALREADFRLAIGHQVLAQRSHLCVRVASGRPVSRRREGDGKG